MEDGSTIQRRVNLLRKNERSAGLFAAGLILAGIYAGHNAEEFRLVHQIFPALVQSAEALVLVATGVIVSKEASQYAHRRVDS